MGEVWRARDTRLGREVAIKTLPGELSSNAEQLARFRREARAASSLNHPNICVIHDLDEQAGRPFIVMELLRGQTLKETLLSGPLEPGDVLELGIQLADGLDAAHKEGIVHRDIKPANIFLTDRGQAKILDFGLARLEAGEASDAPTVSLEPEDLTTPGTTLGTVAYMSPEQARGETLDAGTDLFSLGVVLYEMATGQQPFGGATTAMIFDGILHRTPEPPGRANPGIPQGLDAIVTRLLEKDRVRRPTAGELLSGLKRVQRDSEPRTRASTPTPSKAPGKKSIVVLPFENLSADPDNEYFSDGLTDEIITDLSQVETLRVISRNSSMQLKAAGKDRGKIAQELNVQYVLEGGVRRAGPSVRVTAQLIDTANDAYLWANKYTGKVEDIFDMQEQISRSIVDALKVKLSPEEEQKLAARAIDDVRAFECYHRARQEIYKFSEEGLNRAIDLIQAGLDVVGDNELFYAAMGTVYWQYRNAAIRSEESDLDKADACARKVFELNPDSAPGHELKGLVQYARNQRRAAVQSFKRALAIDPNRPYALIELQRAQQMAGYGREARVLLDRMLAIDPLSAIVHLCVYGLDFFGGNRQKALEEGARLLQTEPDFVIFRLFYVLGLIYDEQIDRAREVLDATPPEDVPSFYGQACGFLRLALDDQPSEAIRVISEETKMAARQVEFMGWMLADCYTLIGEYDTALDWLENGIDRGFTNYPFLSQYDKILRRLDPQPRFQKLLERVKQEWEAFEP